MFICMQEIHFIPPFFLETLQYCKLAILSTLGMPGYGHQEGWHQLVEKCDGYLHATNEIYHSPLCRNMATIFQIYFGYFRLAWPRPPKSMVLTSRKLWCAKIDMQKFNLIPIFFLRTLHFKESCNLIGRKHFGPNVRTRNLLDKDFVVNYKRQYDFSF